MPVLSAVKGVTVEGPGLESYMSTLHPSITIKVNLTFKTPALDEPI